MRRKVILLGTAPDTQVHCCLDFLSGPNTEIHLIVNRRRKHHFEKDCTHIHAVKDRITWFHLSLLILFLRLRPHEIIFLRGEHWFHDNIVSTIRFWMTFNSNPVVWCMKSGEVDGSFQMPNRSHWVSCLFLISLFVWCVVLWFYPWIGFSVLGSLLVLEALLFAFEDFLSFEAQRNGNSSRPQELKKLEVMPHPRLGWQAVPKANQASISNTEGTITLVNDSSGHSPTRLENSLRVDFPTYTIRTLAAPSWSLYQLIMALEERPPEGILVLGLHGKLLWRHTNSFKHRLFDLTYHRNPSCTYNGSKPRYFTPKGYVSFPLRQRLRLIKILENLYNRFNHLGHSNPKLMLQSTEYLLLRIRDVCEQQGCQLFVACLDDLTPLHSFFIRHRFHWTIAESEELLPTVVEGAIKKLQSGSGVFPKAKHLQR